MKCLNISNILYVLILVILYASGCAKMQRHRLNSEPYIIDF